MIFLLFAILDFARIWTTMMSVESAAREAADLRHDARRRAMECWKSSSTPSTKMRWRACVAASDLPDYEGVDADANGVDEDCTNPTFAYCLTPSAGGTCEPAPDDAWIAANTCDDPARDPPCTVTVTLHHVFYLFVPFHINFFGVQLGLPVSLDFDRDSTFAMTDIEVAP